MTRAKILVVEDESEVAETLNILLKKFGYHVVGCETIAEDAIQKAGELRPDLVLMDIGLAGRWNGVQAARYYPEKIPHSGHLYYCTL